MSQMPQGSGRKIIQWNPWRIRQAHCWATGDIPHLLATDLEENPILSSSSCLIGFVWKSPCSEIPGWWFGTWMDYDFPYIGNFISRTDELIFFRGVAQPPTSSASILNPWPLAVTLLTPFVCWGPTKITNLGTVSFVLIEFHVFWQQNISCLVPLVICM